MRLSLLFTVAFGIVFTASVDAQNTGTLPRVLQLPASTHAMALGDAYMMNAGHADAIFYHPALLVGASGFGLDVQRWGANSSSTTVSAARQWLGGGIGVGLQTLQYGAQAEGLLAAPAGQDHLFTLGASPVSERVATVAYARELGGLDIGIATKLVEERVGTTRDAALLVDFGVAADLGPVRAGLTYRNGGRDLSPGGLDMARPDGLTFGLGAYGELETVETDPPSPGGGGWVETVVPGLVLERDLGGGRRVVVRLADSILGPWFAVLDPAEYGVEHRFLFVLGIRF